MHNYFTFFVHLKNFFIIKQFFKKCNRALFIRFLHLYIFSLEMISSNSFRNKLFHLYGAKNFQFQLGISSFSFLFEAAKIFFLHQNSCVIKICICEKNMLHERIKENAT